MLRTLIVDDDPGLRQMLCRALQAWYGGGEHIAVEGITTAYALLLEDAQFDIVLVDGRLQDGDGANLVESIRKAFIGPPFVGMSGDPHALVELAAAGCHAVLQKPFSINQLVAQIEAFMATPEEDPDAAVDPETNLVLPDRAGDRRCTAGAAADLAHPAPRRDRDLPGPPASAPVASPQI